MPPAKRSILFVDDDGDARLIMTLLLGQQGYEVIAVTSSQGTQFISSDDPFDLYIMGPRLLAMNSIALCRQIRKFDKHVPIIIYSRASSESEQDSALRDVGAVFVTNLCSDHLLETVRAELEN